MTLLNSKQLAAKLNPMTPTKTHTPAKTTYQFNFTPDELINILKEQVAKSGESMPEGEYSLHGLNFMSYITPPSLTLEVVVTLA